MKTMTRSFCENSALILFPQDDHLTLNMMLIVYFEFILHFIPAARMKQDKTLVNTIVMDRKIQPKLFAFY